VTSDTQRVAARWTAKSIISRSEAVAKIADRVRRLDESVRESRNRVSHRISYAAKQGRLRTYPKGRFILGELASWAREEWPGLFTEWPAITDINIMETVVCRDFVHVQALPGSLAECHTVVIDLNKRIDELSQALRLAQREIEQLKPAAEAWSNLRDKNARNARVPRK